MIWSGARQRRAFGPGERSRRGHDPPRRHLRVRLVTIGHTPSVNIRDRSHADGEALEAIAIETHALDGYPKYLPADMRAFVMEADALRAWVAEEDGEVIGHVALHLHSAPEVMNLARSATRLDDSRLVVLARLLVAPAARRHGVGRALVETATAEATRLGRRAILDVVTEHKEAIALYERGGWNQVGEVEWCLPDGRPLREFVYVSPSL